MADFFREVDEDVRRDQVIQIWKQYQNWVIGAALLVVVATGVWRGYEYFRLKAAQTAGTRYEAALQLGNDGKSAEAQAAFAVLAQDGPRGYAMLARLAAADALAQKDASAAVKAYDAVAANPAIDPPYQDIARVRAAYLRIDSENPKEFEARYAAYTAPDQSYRNAYRELLALAALKRNDLAGAGHWLDAIVSDPNAPPAMRARATAFLTIVQGGDPAK
jgi:hypothetical protein